MMSVDDKEKGKKKVREKKKEIITYIMKRKKTREGITITLRLVVEKRLYDPDAHLYFFAFFFWVINKKRIKKERKKKKTDMVKYEEVGTCARLIYVY